MDDLKLSEAQARYFGDLFLCCGVSYEKATELFSSANISPDVIRQILRIAQIGENMSQNQISRREFYSCLKLISACQAGVVALSSETLYEDISPMALPRFSWFGDAAAAAAASSSSSALTMNGSLPTTNNSTTATTTSSSSVQVANGQLTSSTYDQTYQKDGGKEAVPGDLIELSHQHQHHHHHHRRSSKSSTATTTAAAAALDQPSTDSEVEQNDDSSAIENSDGRRKYGSPSAWSTGSESPTPTNSVAVKGGPGAGGKSHLWQGLLCEEQRQLLGTEEESSDRHSSDDDPNDVEENTIHIAPIQPPPAAIHSSSSNSLIVIDDTDLLYAITADQRAYYTKQYQAVQKDAAGNVTGPVARVFFEKSRIPVEELRHVWKLCDATKDGALSQAEFMAAMHLVVLRRNNIELPMRLPRCLHADSILRTAAVVQVVVQAQPQQLQEADLLHLNDDADEGGGGGEGDEDARVTGGREDEGDECDGENAADGPESINSVAEDRLMGKQNHHKQQVPSHLPPVAARSGVTAPPPLPLNNSNNNNNNNNETGDWNNVGPTGTATSGSTAWTKFNESPTTAAGGGGGGGGGSGSATATSVSSPGPKPVHFDIQWTVQAVGADPQILHPVALRLTPQGAEAVGSGGGNSGRDRESSTSPNKQQNSGNSSSATSSGGVEFRPIQRPQAKKVKQVTGVGALPPPPVRDSQNMMNMSIDSAVLSGRQGAGDDQSSSPDDEAENSSAGHQQSRQQPPIPPPRQPITRHTRSSSLDLNKLLLQSSAVPQSTSSSLLPEVPPRDAPQAVQPQLSCDSKMETTFADFSRFSEGRDGGGGREQASSTNLATHKPTIPSKRQSAFEVYRKPPLQVSPCAILDQEKKLAHLEEMLRNLNLSREKAGSSSSRVIAGDSTVQQLRDQNAVLVNVCLELGNELFALKYKREEHKQRLQQVNALSRTVDASGTGGAGGGAVAVTSSAAVAGGNGPGSNGSGGGSAGQM